MGVCPLWQLPSYILLSVFELFDWFDLENKLFLSLNVTERSATQQLTYNFWLALSSSRPPLHCYHVLLQNDLYCVERDVKPYHYLLPLKTLHQRMPSAGARSSATFTRVVKYCGLGDRSFAVADHRVWNTLSAASLSLEDDWSYAL